MSLSSNVSFGSGSAPPPTARIFRSNQVVIIR
jgi:hypothetical protein